MRIEIIGKQNLKTVSTADLEVEIARRRDEKPKSAPKPRPPQAKQRTLRITAGERLPKNTLVVVNETTWLAFAYPQTPTIQVNN